MSTMASQITSLAIVYLTIYSGQRKHQSSASLAFVRRIHRWPVNSPHKWPVTRKMFSFDDVTMLRFVCLIMDVYSSDNLAIIDLGNGFVALKAVGFYANQGSWWRHQMETFSELLTICVGNSPVTGEFPAQILCYLWSVYEETVE